MVSGAVALLLDQRPELTPDQVKALLRSTASPMPLRRRAPGAAPASSTSPPRRCCRRPVAQQTWAASTGTGSLEAARGSQHVADGDVELTGERDVLGAWDAASMGQREQRRHCLGRRPLERPRLDR